MPTPTQALINRLYTKDDWESGYKCLAAAKQQTNIKMLEAIVQADIPTLLAQFNFQICLNSAWWHSSLESVAERPWLSFRKHFADALQAKNISEPEAKPEAEAKSLESLESLSTPTYTSHAQDNTNSVDIALQHFLATVQQQAKNTALVPFCLVYGEPGNNSEMSLYSNCVDSRFISRVEELIKQHAQDKP